MCEQRPATHSSKEESTASLYWEHDAQLCASVQLSHKGGHTRTRACTPTHTLFHTSHRRHKHQEKHTTLQEGRVAGVGVRTQTPGLSFQVWSPGDFRAVLSPKQGRPEGREGAAAAGPHGLHGSRTWSSGPPRTGGRPGEALGLHAGPSGDRTGHGMLASLHLLLGPWRARSPHHCPPSGPWVSPRGMAHPCCSQHGRHLQEPQAAGGCPSNRSWGCICPQRPAPEIALATHTISSCLAWRRGDGGDWSSGGPTPRNQNPPCPCTPTSQHPRPVTPRPRLLSAPSQQRGFCGWCEWQAQPGTQPSVGGGRAGSTGLSEGPPPAGPLRPVPLPSQYTDTASQPGEGTWSPEVGDCQRRTWGLQKHCAPGGGPEGRPPSCNRPPPRASGAVCEATIRTNAVLQRRLERTAVDGHCPLLSPRLGGFRWNSSGMTPRGALGVITWGLQLLTRIRVRRPPRPLARVPEPDCHLSSA